MGKRYDSLSEQDKTFIQDQKMFFIASASNGSEVNLSPRGYDVFRILEDNEVIFLDYVGSGNRTARDINADGEVTVVFCAYEGSPKILRLFCKGEVISKDDLQARAHFEGVNFEGMRQFIKLRIYCVESSCGMSVPFFEYKGERDTLREWCIDGERNGKIEAYQEKNGTPPDLSEFRQKNL
ncbi:pyridoxamine 5'-phosphate oxidase family protein [Sulfurimonas sp.]|uniref:pyridoxamine 5'-phosphate oxidase family protein n=1 Tax=Sulfurimonas sp. TaxID=2022749 RepID=UPI003D14DFFB